MNDTSLHEPKEEPKPEPGRQIAVQPRREIRVVEDVVPLMDTARFEQMQRIAHVMAHASLCPDALKKNMSDAEAVANCFLVVNQAIGWEMDPFAVAQMVSVISGKLCYEGKLIHAIIEAKLGIRLRYTFTGQARTDARAVLVSGRFEDEAEDRTVEGTVAEWKTTRNGSPWQPSAYDRQLTYRGAREWARRHAPGILLGVYDRDELEEGETWREPVDVTPPSAPEFRVTKPGAVTSAGEVISYQPETGEVVETPTVEDFPDLPTHLVRKAEAEEQKAAALADQKAKEEAAKKAAAMAQAPLDSAPEPGSFEPEDAPPDVEAKPGEQPTGDALDQFQKELDAAKDPREVKAIADRWGGQIGKMIPPDITEARNMVTKAYDRFRER